jgi:hypothetical protein
MALDAGVTLAEAVLLARHANAKVTAQVYAGLSEKAKAEVAAKLVKKGRRFVSRNPRRRRVMSWQETTWWCTATAADSVARSTRESSRAAAASRASTGSSGRFRWRR